MNKFTERIALEKFQYVEISADTFNELVTLVKQVKEIYATRLQKDEPGAAYASKQPFPSGMQMAESGMTCAKCNAPMVWKTQTSKKTGKPYSAWFCPNGSVQDKHPIVFPDKK